MTHTDELLAAEWYIDERQQGSTLRRTVYDVRAEGLVGTILQGIERGHLPFIEHVVKLHNEFVGPGIKHRKLVKHLEDAHGGLPNGLTMGYTLESYHRRDLHGPHLPKTPVHQIT